MIQEIAESKTDELNCKTQQSELSEQGELPAREETIVANKYNDFVSKVDYYLC